MYIMLHLLLVIGNKNNKAEKELYDAVAYNNKDKVIELLARGVSSTGYKNELYQVEVNY